MPPTILSSEPADPLSACRLDLDHVAIATFDSGAVVEALVRQLGARPQRWGGTDGFRAVQCRMGTGMTLEIIEPYRTSSDDFVQRFLAQRGPGLHHLTFRTSDLDAVHRRLEQAGRRPDIDRRNGSVQRELFFAPGNGHGTVVQVVEKGGIAPGGADAAGRVGPIAMDPWWKTAPGIAAATEARIEASVVAAVLATDDIADAAFLFGTLLGGQLDRPRSPKVIDWPGGRLRLVHSSVTRGLRALEGRVPGSVQPPEVVIAGARFVFDAGAEGTAPDEPRPRADDPQVSPARAGAREA